MDSRPGTAIAGHSGVMLLCYTAMHPFPFFSDLRPSRIYHLVCKGQGSFKAAAERVYAQGGHISACLEQTLGVAVSVFRILERILNIRANARSLWH